MTEGKTSKHAERSRILDAVVSLEKKGFAVLPIRSPYKHVLGNYLKKKNGKYPESITVLWSIYFGRKTGVRAFASPRSTNIGVLTGRKYNLVIIDVDFPRGGKSSMKKLALPETLTACTGNGLHLYYLHPGGKIPTCAGRLAPGIDVKGENSYATAPPSLHYSGFRYQWLDENADISELPAETVDALRKLPGRGQLRSFIHITALANILLPVSALLGNLFQGFKQKS